MKLPKSKGCLFPFDGGNVKKQTMIVEGQGIGFWTRVRLPSTPLDGVLEEPRLKRCKLSLYENVFGITFYINEYDTEKEAKKDTEFTFADIQKWIKDNLDMNVSKSSITMVKEKCKIDKIVSVKSLALTKV